MTPPRRTTTLDDLLEFIKTTRGFDFTGYKRSTLERRVAKRMGEVGVEHYGDYVEYLELHAEEFARPLQHDPDQRHGLLPRPADVGVPGGRARPRPASSPRRRARRCASGAPAARQARRPTPSPWCSPSALGEQAFRDRVKIYATDVDEEALDQARAAALPAKAVEGVPPRRSRSTSSAPTSATSSARTCAERDLRPQRPRAGRADLAHRPARLPQHAHVLQRRDAGADPAALPLRAGRRRRAAARQVGDAAQPRRPVRARRPQAPGVPQGCAGDAARPGAGPGA